jgi:Bacteriophage protein of unknown function (DUF646).
MASINIDNLAAEITLAVKEYTEDVAEAIEKEADLASQRLVKEIRARSPRRTGEYAKGWTRKKQGREGEIRYVIYNRKKPWLAHLLEFGHAKRGGGRVEGRPHIRPTADREIEAFQSRVRAIIRNGG